MPDEKSSEPTVEPAENQAPESQEPSPWVEEPAAPSEDYQELHNRYLRLAADFENFRKRQAQEREFLFKYGAQNTLEQLLPVLDNLERAQQSLTENSDPQMLFKSFEMLSQQLLDALKAVGLQKMHPQGQPFDPELHDAISQTPDDSVPEHTILQVYQDGYTLHDRVLRPAKVIVSVKPQPGGDTDKFDNPADKKAAGNQFTPQTDTNKNPFQQTPVQQS